MPSRPQFDPLQYALRRYQECQPALAFRATSREAALAWQKELRAKLAELMGGFPASCPLQAREGRAQRFDRYTRRPVVFASRPGLDVFGWLLVPRGRRLRRPALLCLPGHGRGCDEIVGIAADGSQRAQYGEYQHDFALQAVHRGYVALAIEQLAFGRRRDAVARRGEAGASSCQPAAGSALLLGESMIGWRVYDAMRALDYLQSRPEVDPARLGAMGISGGGTTTLHLACMDERVQVAMVSGYLNTFRDSIFSISHCMDNYLPGMLKWAEMYDLAGLIAPRALWVESGTQDGIFPVAATRRALGRVQEIYRVFGVPGQLGWQVFRGVHEFRGTRFWPFSRRVFNWPGARPR